MTLEIGGISEKTFVNKEGTPYKLTELIHPEEIQRRVKELGQQISQDYKGKKLVLVAPLKGGNTFLVDLMRQIDNDDLEIEFVEASSYGDRTSPDGVVITKDFNPEAINGKHVLIVEDIVDTGHTMFALLQKALGLGAKSIQVAALLSKPSRREVEVPIDYLGFEIEDKFVVGYGLDYQQRHRQHEGIYVVNFQ